MQKTTYFYATGDTFGKKDDLKNLGFIFGKFGKVWSTIDPNNAEKAKGIEGIIIKEGTLIKEDYAAQAELFKQLSMGVSSSIDITDRITMLKELSFLYGKLEKYAMTTCPLGQEADINIRTILNKAECALSNLACSIEEYIETKK